MDKIQVMMVLHAYQPPYPIQEQRIVKRIIENCYKPIVENLENYSNIKIVVNINASLTEILLKEAPEIIELFAQNAKSGKIEFLESGAYHPIFPLISLKHTRLQLEVNNKINSKAFGLCYKPKGIWPPELAVNKEVVQLFMKMGYKYVIGAENSSSYKSDVKFPYLAKDGKQILLVNRNRDLSNSISFNSYNKKIENAVNDFDHHGKNTHLPIVIATDMETFGEHNPNYWKFLFDFLSHPKIQTIQHHIIKETYPSEQIIEITASSWSTTESDIQKGIAYPLWDHPLNPIHTIQHTHFDLLQQYYENKHKIEQLLYEDLILYMKSAQSCQFWWADKKQGRWSPSIIRKGIELQRMALRSLIDNTIPDELSERLINRLENILKLSS